jgi:tetratricopeptide (TPR) repeat protein
MQGHEEIGGAGSLVKVVFQNLPYMFLYIGKILLPFNLNVMPGVNTEAIILGCISFAVLAALFYYIKDRRRMLFCLIWYFIFLAPTLLVPELPAYEHRDYLPLIGLLIGMTQVSFFTNYSLKANRTTYVFIALAAVFFTISAFRLPVFADRFAFWLDGTEGTPFADNACVNVGQLYQEIYDHEQNKSALQQAGEWTKKALAINDSTLRGNNNYGAYLYLSGHRDEAAVYFQKEIKYHPTNTDAYKNMGIYYRDKGEPAKSVYYWQKLIDLNRYYLTAYEDLANYYKQTGDMKKSQYYASQGQQLAEESEKQYRKMQ